MISTGRVLLLIIFISGLCFSQNYPSYPVGTHWYFPDARSLSLGGAGSVSLASATAMLYNPAALTRVEHFISTTVSLSARRLEERRAYPLYDRFDSVIGKGIYAINNNWYLKPQGAVAVRISSGGLPRVTLALGSFSEIDQNYKYIEEVRENIFGDPLMAYNRIELEGALQRYGVAIAAALPNFPRISLGFQAGFLDGSLDYLNEINFIDTARADIVQHVSRSLDNTPLIFSAGLIFDVDERITLGVDSRLPYTVDYRSKDDKGNILTERIEYPFKVNVGFEYRSRQILQARLNLDFSYEFWSSVNYRSQIGGVVTPLQDFSDVYKFRAGIEHIFFNQVPFRFGMQYRNSYRQQGQTQTLLSAGTGFLGRNWQVDVGGAFSRASYRWGDLFDDSLFGGDRSGSPLDDVDETYFFGMVSLKYNFDL